MKNIYLVQANAVYGDKIKNTYIPYAIGCLAAYAFSFEEIKSEYTLQKFIYTRKDINTALSEIKNPYLIGFSSNIWNNEYNKALSKAVKEKYPDCIIVFGGHQIPPNSKKAFTEYKYADFLIHAGGEEAFSEILLALKNHSSFDLIDNISYKNSNNDIIDTKRSNPITPDYPSPYLCGFFDNIMEDGYQFSAIIETNRGCPNKCAFCDWGVLKSKVRLFDLAKVYSELEWLARNNVEYVYCADANFGLFDRDMDITEKFIQLKNDIGYPKKLKVNFTKNRTDFVGKISKRLSENDMGKSQTLSFQSVDKKVLNAIGRKNIDLEHFKELLIMYSKADIPTYSELILGLPEETYESFTEGICTLLENGQHKSINVYPCELLPNSKLGSEEYINKYEIKTTKLPFEQFHCAKKNDGITEYSYLITSTSSMTKNDWVNTYFFATMIQSFHCLDITRESAIFFRETQSISYLEFYSKLLEFINTSKGSYLQEIFSRIKNHFSDVAQARQPIGFYDKRFGNISYEPDEHMFLSCIYDTEKLYADILSFFTTLTKPCIAKELIEIQKALLNLPNKKAFQKEFSFDFISFFNKSENGEKAEITKKPVTVEFTSPYEAPSWDIYARECVWYGRRNEGMHMKTKIINT